MWNISISFWCTVFVSKMTMTCLQLLTNGTVFKVFCESASQVIILYLAWIKFPLFLLDSWSFIDMSFHPPPLRVSLLFWEEHSSTLLAWSPHCLAICYMSYLLDLLIFSDIIVFRLIFDSEFILRDLLCDLYVLWLIKMSLLNYFWFGFCRLVFSVTSVVSDSVIQWTIAHQAPLSMGVSRQEYWDWLPFPPSGNLPDPGTEPEYLVSLALAGRFFTTRATWEAQWECVPTTTACRDFGFR